MLGLRQLMPLHLQLSFAQWPALEQAWAASLPAVTQQLQQSCSQLQQTCSMAKKAAKKPPTMHERRVASSKYCQARAEWHRQVKQLRKQWWREHLAKMAAHRASSQLAAEQVAQLREMRDASKQVDRQKHLLERQVRETERAAKVAELRLASAYRQSLREHEIQKHKEARRAALLEASRSWIPPEALQSRIAAALDNPQDL